MFTGLVDHCGRIESITKTATDYIVVIATSFCDLVLGESIAVDGACLTVVAMAENQFTVQVSPETMRLTTIGQYAVDGLVNLERSLRLTDRLGGHFVTGHVDGLCQVYSIEQHDKYVGINFNQVTTLHRRYLVTKGSITVNGVSLTLNAITADGFEVMLIPHTLERTNLSRLQPGDHVNIEYDYLAKIVHNQIQVS